MNISINRNANAAIYQQIASQIKTLINTGQLPDGTRLPTIRKLAAQLDVNRLTVQNAYYELQEGGWIESIVGNGTYVSSRHPIIHSYRTLNCERTPNNFLIDMEAQSKVSRMRSLASADPDVSLAPVDEFMGSLSRLHYDAESLMRYTEAAGDEQLRLQIVELLRTQGVLTAPDHILLTTGATQAIFIAAMALTQPGDYVLVHQPLFVGLTHSLTSLGLNLIPIAFDHQGPDIEAVEQAIERYQPKLLFVVSSFNNPTGYSVSPSRKEALVDISNRHNLYLIEDDVYSLLAYDYAVSQPMKAFDCDERIIYVSSFSKILMPGLRIGYMIMPDHLRELFLAIRRATDLSGQTILQRALAIYLKSGRLHDHLQRVNAIYKSRRDALLQSLTSYMPRSVQWTKPSGGFSCWVTLPEDKMLAIYREALQMEISFAPGTGFLVGADTNRHFRLSFGNQSAGEIQEIVQLLGKIVSHQLDAR